MSEFQVKKISLRKEMLKIFLDAPESDQGLEAGLHHDMNGKEKTFPFRIRRQGRNLLLEFSFFDEDRGSRETLLTEGDWEVYLQSSASSCREPLILNSRVRMALLLKGMRRNLPGGNIVFPMAGDENRLILRCRGQAFYDSASVWWKERLAYIWCTMLRLLRIKADTWVIFEKFCAQAQDNGAAFFMYCMEHLKGRERARVFYILDKNAPAWKRMQKAYGRQVVPFMSFKHMCLMMRSPLYAASESRYQGYAWRSVPNPVLRQIRTGDHRILFLQHGVTAFKNVNSVFGKHGYNPMTWFAVTSEAEKKLVMDHLGYTDEETPVLGFARWDLLEDRQADCPEPFILLMPTWRSGLDGQSAEVFRQSEYCRIYSSLLDDPELLAVLKEYGICLYFYIHPKLADMLGELAVDHPGPVRLIPYAGRNLADLLMSCRALITDYSSVSWDVHYMKKPVLFFQFDLEHYLQDPGSLVDMEKDLFGDRFDTSKELIRGVRELAERGFTERPEFAAGRRERFAHVDKENCARTFRFLKRQGF